ncbi:MAG: carboxypeptidase regulatory-like domain-containing protein [Bryobacterales bacterium]|nr:carboxypeptidase regulatory-like domain-containing protein [Bryobacterales bacterium]
MTKFAAPLLLWMLTCGSVFAQDYRAKVQGTVTDATGAIVAEAQLRLRNINTGIEAAKTSNQSGQFLFDFVEPGTYELTAELAGFSRFVQQNILVQTRGDITVNPVLKLGQVVETVNVAAQTVEVQFNTSTMSLTVDRKMLTDLPVLARNPFTLVLLDPAVVNRYTTNLATRNPFYMWSSSQLDVGGNTSTKNELQLDGAPLQLGYKGSYAPPMDATQEVAVQQNAVDAEYGHSAGGVLTLSVKSGTNEYHGTAYYFGRNPALNAVTNSVVRAPNLVRNHIYGGTFGNPIVKNKLFNFVSFERWQTKDPRQAIMTLPSELERGGDFSQSLNPDGGLRAIFDPFTTQLSSAGVASRTPFPGNRIPVSQMDPLAVRFMKDIWLPNGPGDNITGVNNYKQAYFWYLYNWNFNNRTDWNVNDKWKIFGRYSRFRTDLSQNNYTPNNSPAMTDDNGGVMNSRNIAADAVWTTGPSTVINFRWSYATLNDDYDSPKSAIGGEGLKQFWPNAWYQSYLPGIPAVYYPNLAVSGVGSASFGKGGYWYQHPQSYNYSGRVSKNMGRHYLKWGGESRLLRGSSVRPNLMNFSFGPAFTADTFQAPNTRLRGDGWATFLLGALDSSSQAQHIPLQEPRTDFYAAYIQDDFKVNKNLTINLGLRYEYETGLFDPLDRVSRPLDLTAPIPDMQKNPPPIPADIAALRGQPYHFTGPWQFAGNGNPRGMWDSNKKVFMPRLGVAIRLSDRMSLRAGYARYVIPPLLVSDVLGAADSRYAGFGAITTVAPSLQGVPQARISDPFPAGSNPLIPPVGRSLGIYTRLGSQADWNEKDMRTGVNDRFNISFQRQLPFLMHADVTYFMNFGHDMPYNDRLNLADPNLSYTYKALLDQTVSNPFYQYLTPQTFPGQLRNQPTVSRGSLLRPYPQYLDLTQFNTSGFLNRYHALQVKVQRNFNNGLMFLVAYNFNREQNSNFFNDPDEYAGRATMLDSNNPRHRISTASVYELPFGKGHKYLSNANPFVNAVFGGWSTSTLLFYNSGAYLRFGTQVGPDNTPAVYRDRAKWFDLSGFNRQPAYTPRTNPWQYPDLTGPRNWNLDVTLSKFFPMTERIKLELRLESYNLTNSFVPNDPATAFTSATFGRTTTQNNRGREFQYTARIHF